MGTCKKLPDPDIAAGGESTATNTGMTSDKMVSSPQIFPAEESTTACSENSSDQQVSWNAYGTNANKQDMTYQRRKDAANSRGCQYEYKMATLLCLRALNQTGRFWLGTNVANAGHFDDIVLRCQGRINTLLLVQLKHKERDNAKVGRLALAAEKGNFSLNKYFQSYLQVLQDPELCKLIDHARFVLYTNSAVEMKDVNSAKNTHQELKSLLNTGSSINGCISSFDVNDDVCAFFKDHPSAQDFIRKLTLFSKQANEGQLNVLIMQELVKYCKRLVPKLNIVYDKLLAKVQEWWQPRDTNNRSSYITETWPAWKNIKETIKGRNILLPNVKFLPDVLEELLQTIFAPDSIVVHISYDGADDQLRTLKMLQALEKRGQTYMLISAAEKNLSLVLEMWAGGWCDVLAIDIMDRTLSKQQQELLEQYCDIMSKYGTKKLILLSGKRAPGFAQHLKKHFKSSWRDSTDTCEFRQLTERSRELVLDLLVVLQGTEVTLRPLCSNHVRVDVLKGEILSNILGCKKRHTFGKPPPPSSDTHIPRAVQKKVTIDAAILSSYDTTDSFMITGAKIRELNAIIANGQRAYAYTDNTPHNARYILSEETDVALLEQRFNSLCKHKTNKPLHWLEKRNTSLYWKKSHGDTSSLLKYIQSANKEADFIHWLVTENKSCSIGAGDLARVKMRTVLVTGEPGMGKTTFLTNMVDTIKKIHPHSWVLRVSLNDITKKLSEINPCSVTLQDVCSILQAAAGVANSTIPELAAALLEDSMERTGNVVVLLDAFDEVSPSYTQTVIGILRVILESKVSALWITSRYLMQQKLECELETEAFELKPFTHDEKISFLVNVWKITLNNYVSEDLRNSANRLLQLVHSRFPLGRGESISSNPLNMMMVAEAYRKAAVTGSFDEIVSTLSLQDLYGTFINERFDVYCQKKKMDMTIPGVISDTIQERSRFWRRHTFCAIELLQISDQLSVLHTKEMKEEVKAVLESIEKGEEKIGIICGMINSKPHFIHYTFAEFFVARWLAEQTGETLPNFDRILFQPRLKFVKSMFDSILAARCPLHLAVLNNDLEGVRAGLANGVNSVDAGGRTALHLAAQNRQWLAWDVLILLLKNGADLEVKDRIMQCTPIYYAAKAKLWDRVEIFLRWGALITPNIAGENLVQEAIKAAIVKFNFLRLPYLSIGFDTNWTIFCGKRAILHLAAGCGYLGCVKMLLEKGAQIDITDKDQLTPLHYAVEAGYTNVAHQLLKSGADINCMDFERNTPLHYACSGEHYRLVRLLLDRGANVNARTNRSETALHKAKDHTKIVKLLIENNVDVNARDSDGNSPMHAAARLGYEHLVKLLLKNGADVNGCNKFLATPLALAVQEGYDGIVKILIQAGADAAMNDNKGRTILHLAVFYNRKNIVKFLLASGADVTAKDYENETPVHLSARLSSLEILTLLAGCGADLTTVNATGDTPLHIACKTGNHEAAQYLLMHVPRSILSVRNVEGATPHYAAATSHNSRILELLVNCEDSAFTNSAGNTPLHLACQESHYAAVKYLLAHSPCSDLSLKNVKGDTPLHISCRRGHSEIVLYLVNHGPCNVLCLRNEEGDTPCHAAAISKNPEILKVLVNYGADITVTNKKGNTPLHIACLQGHPSTVEYLLTLDSNSVLSIRNEEGDTPLHIAAKLLVSDVPKQLVDHGADVAVPNNKGNTPLHIACLSGSYAVVRYLLTPSQCDNLSMWDVNSTPATSPSSKELNPEIDITATNKNGDTPLHIACRTGSYLVARCLLTHGPPTVLFVSNLEGHTPLEAAMSKQRKEIVQYLHNHLKNIVTTRM